MAASDPNHPNRFLFTGREFDTETGLYYYRARYYNPTIGRFLQTDPIGYGNGLNWYAYCENNSINRVDPMGMWAGFKMNWVDCGGTAPTLQVLCLNEDGSVGTDFYFEDYADLQRYVYGGGDFCDVSFQDTPNLWGLLDEAVKDLQRTQCDDARPWWAEALDAAAGLLPASEVDGTILEEIQKGAAATFDGFWPFGDPFEYMYTDADGNMQTVYMWSQTCGSTAFYCAAVALHPNLNAAAELGRAYEVGSSTVASAIYNNYLAGWGVAEKATLITECYGTGGTAAIPAFLQTIGTGPTPAAWAFGIVAVPVSDMTDGQVWSW